VKGDPRGHDGKKKFRIDEMNGSGEEEKHGKKDSKNKAKHGR